MIEIPYAKHELTEEDIQAVEEALRSGMLTNGQRLRDFEDGFCNYVDSKFALGISSGTAGLHLAVLAMQVPTDKTILVPSLTFAATANAALYVGANIEFVDVNPQTLVIDVSAIEEKLRLHPNKYAGVIAVDFAGYPLDIIALSRVCKENGIWLIEDAAHALGSVYRYTTDVRVGSSEYADITVFSFHPAKHITTGEGGMVTTRNEKLYNKMKLLRSHAMDKNNDQAEREGWYYRIEELGYNYRLGEMNAALGLNQLKRAQTNLSLRRKIAATYTSAFRDVSLRLPYEDSRHIHAYHLYVVQSSERAALYAYLKEQGIYSQVHYVPLHMQPYYRKIVGDIQLPHTESYYQGCLSLPMYPTLSDEEINHVITTVRQFDAT